MDYTGAGCRPGGGLLNKRRSLLRGRCLLELQLLGRLLWRGRLLVLLGRRRCCLLKLLGRLLGRRSRRPAQRNASRRHSARFGSASLYIEGHA